MEEEWEDDDPVQPLSGGPPGGDGAEVVADLILDLLCATTKLEVLLLEALLREVDESEWRALASRLGRFRALVDGLPLTPGPRRKVGFKVAAKAPKAAKRPTKFQDFMREVEEEARAEGPEAVAELEALRTHFKKVAAKATKRRRRGKS